MECKGLNRREVLSGLTVGAGGVALSVRQLSAQQYHIGGSNFKLGVASYSFRKFSREKAIQMTKELGTPYMNIKDVQKNADTRFFGR